MKDRLIVSMEDSVYGTSDILYFQFFGHTKRHSVGGVGFVDDTQPLVFEWHFQHDMVVAEIVPHGASEVVGAAAQFQLHADGVEMP